MRFLTLGMALSFALIAPAKTADADSKHLALGEVGVVAIGAAHMTPALRTALEAEIRDLDLRAAHKDSSTPSSITARRRRRASSRQRCARATETCSPSSKAAHARKA